ncbi:pyrroline-5-carboxylate reductase [Oenococcus sp. UCMA 17063]|nr:pyrroline-5-carboxylate reductase [Oenococcus sp. UCMA 17063]
MKYGFLGAGNLASAIIEGLLKNGVESDSILVNSPHSAAFLSKKLGIDSVGKDQLLADCDLIVLAFLPEQLKDVIQDIGSEKFTDKLVVSVLGSLSLKRLADFLPTAKLVRVLPNVNAEFNNSLTSVSFGQKLSNEDVQSTKDFLQAFGTVIELPEKDFPAFSAIAGSGPAFVALFIKALQEAGIKQGIDSDESLQIALHTVKGSTENILKSNKTAKQLIEKVASPGGSTADGVKSLEKDHFIESVNNAILATINHGKK